MVDRRRNKRPEEFSRIKTFTLNLKKQNILLKLIIPEGHNGDVASLSLNPSAKEVFVTGSVDKTARLWDLRVPGILYCRRQDIPIPHFELFMKLSCGNGSQAHLNPFLFIYIHP